MRQNEIEEPLRDIVSEIISVHEAVCVTANACRQTSI